VKEVMRGVTLEHMDIFLRKYYKNAFQYHDEEEKQRGVNGKEEMERIMQVFKEANDLYFNHMNGDLLSSFGDLLFQ